jgi:hypothetical protein
MLNLEKADNAQEIESLQQSMQETFKRHKCVTNAVITAIWTGN